MLRRSFRRAVGGPSGGRLPGGERVLAGAETVDGTVVAGSRDALHLAPGTPEARRIPWETVETAEWNGDAGVLRLREVGEGAPGDEHVLRLGEAGLLLELVRERVTASVVLQREVSVPGGAKAQIVARRAPHGKRQVVWSVRPVAGSDPSDPTLAAAVAEALARAKDDVGLA